MYKVSVIVPVYNTSMYLEKCLDSILNQTLDDIEIILLNDGSKDDSESIILNKYIKNKKIKYFKHDNIGLGETRNKGISIATGEYVAFIDSDDSIENNMLLELYENAKSNDSDISCCEVYLDKDNEEKKIRKKFDDNNFIEVKEEKIEYFLKKFYFSRKYSHNAWDKIYRLNFIKDNNIKFGDNKKIFAEDNFFQLQIINNKPKISFVNKALYNYYIRQGSIMNSYKEKLVERNVRMLEDFDEIMDSKMKGEFNKLISILIFDILVAEAINISESNKNFNEFKKSLIKLEKSKFINLFLNEVINNKAYNYESKLLKKLFIKSTAYLIKFNFNNMLTNIFYIKYKLLRGIV